MDNHYNHFKKIDAHSHIGKFGSPFNIDFDLSRLTEQMEEYNIEKTILCPAGCHLNKELKEICLLDQVYVKAEDGKQSVSKYVEEVAKANNAKIAIKGFVRMETGEGIEKKEEDFAAEVAAQMAGK